MHLEIITPEKKLFAGEVKLVQAPGSMGSFEILNNHAPIISTLETGKIKVVNMEDVTTFIDIGGGLLEAKQNKITILAEPVKT